jgi:lipid II:glycine glycyltransferase (peptidoglycan interpeptide bridge formation enzyme)
MMVSRIGAITPIAAYVGNRPMMVVAPAISKMVKANVRLRPILSPSMPKNSPPKGRKAKATANTANVLSNAALASPLGKNSWAMVVARKP